MSIIPLNRRRALQSLLAFTAVSSGAGIALAGPVSKKKIVVVILRGAMDGLSAVVPYADQHYLRLREHTRLASPGVQGGVRPLTDGFGLHPSLAFLHQAWTKKELLVLHAASTPYRARSHFDGQDFLEFGAGGLGTVRDGWLNRALNLYSGAEGLALTGSMPILLQGKAKAINYSPSRIESADQDTLSRLADLYANDPALSLALASALDLSGKAGTAGMMRQGMRGGRSAAWPNAAKMLGDLMAAPDGPSAGVLSFEGWDTHNNQGGATGELAGRLASLDESLQALQTAFGAQWQNTAVVVATEFGRTAEENGTRGTDHGTGSAAFMVGGAVKGGRMIGDWPGLAPSALFEGRDLYPANDLRLLFASALQAQWGLSSADLSSTVFPSLDGRKIDTGLLRGA